MRKNIYTLIRKIDKNTYGVFHLFIAIYYIAPMVTSYIWKDDFGLTFDLPEYSLFAIMIPVVYGFVRLFDILIPRLRLPKKLLLGYILNNRFLIFSLNISFLLFSIWFAKSFSLSFRQHQSLLDVGGFAIILFALRAVFKLYILFLLMRKLVGLELTSFHRLMAFITGVSFLLSLSASLDMIQIILAFVFTFKLDGILASKIKSDFKKVLVNLSVVVFLPILFFSVLYIGMANKIGTEKAQAYLVSTDGLEYVIKLASIRTSTFYMALEKSGEELCDSYFFQTEAILGTANNLKLRLCSLVGAKCGERSRIWSLNRQNYLLVFNQKDNPRTGASPGVFAMVFYFPFFPWSILVTSLYIFCILRLISRQLSKSEYFIPFFTKIILMIYILPLFENPIGYINFIDPSSIYLVSFIMAFTSLHNEIGHKDKGLV